MTFIISYFLMNYIYWIFAVFIVSLISIIGIITLWYPLAKLKKILIWFIAFSAGILLWDAFLHLLPEAVEQYWFSILVSFSLIWWIVIGFLIEKILNIVHINKKSNEIKTFARMNLVGDMVHNMIDWIIIWVAFLINPTTWLATTLAVILHEIPQEIWDFCVLVHWWLSKRKALIYNFLTALTAFIGLLVSYLLNSYVDNISQILMPLSAWLFIYIAVSDMIPEMHKENQIVQSILQIVLLLVGIFVMLLLSLWE